ncbi:MAG: LysM peptidoglycan-binding domain-containing protein [Clostridiales bacterium]|nr:LysM peptidoglycan-binding domain-containing protein [Clostridiales bacterium]
MELELNGTSVDHFELIQDSGYSREETLEMIVPDACPDIVQVVDTWGFCCLTRREVTDSGALLVGRVRVTILYIPEGDGGLQKLEAELPFQHLSECAQVDGSTRLLVNAWVSSAETRILNPRKVLIRTDLCEKIQLYRLQTLRVYGTLDADEALGLQTRQQQEQADLVTQTAEKAFVLEEELSLSGIRSVSAVPLQLRPEAFWVEARLIGSKLVLKGTAQIQSLWQEEGGGLIPNSFELPFSQMLDAAGVGEGAQYQACVQIQSWQTGQPSGDGRSLPITLDLCAQAVFCERIPFAFIADAYSVYYPTELHTEQWAVCRQSQEESRQSVREFAPCEQSIQTILDCHEELGLVQVAREDSQYTVTVPISAAVLCLDEKGDLFSVLRSFSVSLQPPCPPEQRLRCSCTLLQMEALPAAAGLELRGTVMLRFQAMEETLITGLAGLKVDQEHPQEYAGQPSVVLRRPAPSESLWDIAKRCSTTCQEICSANGLAEDQPLGNQMLLIPRKR